MNKANEKEERDRRRKSVALPASLSAPSIVSLSGMRGLVTHSQAPRQNRSSALRTGGDIPPTSSRALTTSAVANVEEVKPGGIETKTGLTRRSSMGVRSLGVPSIVSHPPLFPTPENP